MRPRATVTVVGLLLLAGCSSGGQPPQSSPPPPPRPDQALVAWAETVCAQVSALDELRPEDGTGAAPYQVSSAVGYALDELAALDASGLADADSYVATLTRALERLRDELPAGDDTPPSPGRVTELLGELGPQEPELAASLHLAPSCTPLDPPPAMTTE